MILFFASFGLNNAWSYAPVVRDVNGTAIVLGSSVKLVGVVTGINYDTGTIQINLKHPDLGIIQSQGNLQLVVGS